MPQTAHGLSEPALLLGIEACLTAAMALQSVNWQISSMYTPVPSRKVYLVHGLATSSRSKCTKRSTEKPVRSKFQVIRGTKDRYHLTQLTFRNLKYEWTPSLTPISPPKSAFPNY